jgi:extracellular matrix regulatory protein B
MMYLHLGNNIVVRERDIIGIFDLDKCSTGQITRDFLSQCEKSMRVTNAATDIPRSFILCEDEMGERIYLSQITAQTLRSRSENPIF